MCILEHGEGIEPLEGPALIQLPDTVIVVRPEQSARMDPFGNIIIDMQKKWPSFIAELYYERTG